MGWAAYNDEGEEDDVQGNLASVSVSGILQKLYSITLSALSKFEFSPGGVQFGQLSVRQTGSHPRRKRICHQ